MGNLIERDNLGNWSIKNLPWSRLHIGQTITQETNQVLYGCLAKLKDYEATGLSPDQVQQLKESIPEKIKPEKAEYAHEASYIEGWNACLEKIAPVQ